MVGKYHSGFKNREIMKSSKQNMLEMPKIVIDIHKINLSNSTIINHGFGFIKFTTHLKIYSKNKIFIICKIFYHVNFHNLQKQYFL